MLRLASSWHFLEEMMQRDDQCGRRKARPFSTRDCARPMSQFRSLPAAGFTILPKAMGKWLPHHAFHTPVGHPGPDPETKCTDLSKNPQALSDLFPISFLRFFRISFPALLL